MSTRRTTRPKKPQPQPPQKTTEVCRTCMTATASQEKRRWKPVPIFSKLDGKSIANIIMDCTAVQIEANDALPSVICAECYETVKLVSAFKQTTRNSDTKLRKLCKAEAERVKVKAEEDTTDLLEIKCESLEDEMMDETAEDATLESIEDEAPVYDDSGSDWKGSDEEVKQVQRTVKRQKVGLRSKPKPRKRSAAGSSPRRKPIQPEDDLKLSQEEQELFKVIPVPPKSHLCCGCLQIFQSEEELDGHRKKFHVWKNENMTKPMPSKLLCEGCLRRYDSERSFNLHKERIQLLAVIWECNKCNFRFKAADKRRKHVRIHAEGEPVAVLARFSETTKKEFGWLCCSRNCGQSFQSEQELIDHAQEAHWIDKQEADLDAGDKPEQCQICFRRFEDRKKIIWHQRRLYKRKNLQCEHCGLKFTTTVKLNTHEMKEHGNSAFKCELCSKTFTQKYSLINHVKYMHTQEKQHQCTVCGMTFRQKGGLKTHMSNHVEVPQFKCEVCSKMFKAKLHLRYHMRTHTGEKPYKCRYCDHAFANNTNFRRHEMTHTDIKPHKCSQCDRSFILRRTMLDHEKTHTSTGEQTSQRKQPNKSRQKTCYVDFTEYSVIHVDEDEEEDDDDEYEDEDDDICNDNTYQQQPETISIANRPVTIKVLNHTVAQPAGTVQKTATPPAAATKVIATTTTSPGVSPASKVAVYNIVSPSIPAVASTSGPGNYSYVLKFK